MIQSRDWKLWFAVLYIKRNDTVPGVPLVNDEDESGDLLPLPCSLGLMLTLPFLALSVVDGSQRGSRDWSAALQPYTQQTAMPCVFGQLSVRISFKFAQMLTLTHFFLLLTHQFCGQNVHFLPNVSHPLTCALMKRKSALLTYLSVVIILCLVTKVSLTFIF